MPTMNRSPDLLAGILAPILLAGLLLFSRTPPQQSYAANEAPITDGFEAGWNGGRGWNSTWSLLNDTKSGIITSWFSPQAGDRHVLLVRNGDISRGFSLSGYSAATLSYWAKAAFWRNNDSVRVQVSSDEKTWTTVQVLGADLRGGVYQRHEVNLDRWAGLPSVHLRFQASMDGMLALFFLDSLQIDVTVTSPESTSTATPIPSPPTSNIAPSILFGLGPEADSAISQPLAQDAPLGMLTSWYNGPNDLAWMSGWANGFIQQLYSKGYALHLIIFSDGEENGTPCGRPYPISQEIDSDMKDLAKIFAGQASGPPLYVTLFAEFQTYPCTDGQWVGAEDYYGRLKTKMLTIESIFHTYAPNARVSIGWGGWQTRWDSPTTGGGKSLFQYFSDVMEQMDFQSFQAMQGDSNVQDVRSMVSVLGADGPVMLANYKPDGFHPDVYRADLTELLTAQEVQELTSKGLFAWSFMDTEEVDASPDTYKLVADAIRAFD